MKSTRDLFVDGVEEYTIDIDNLVWDETGLGHPLEPNDAMGKIHAMQIWESLGASRERAEWITGYGYDKPCSENMEQRTGDEVV